MRLIDTLTNGRQTIFGGVVLMSFFMISISFLYHTGPVRGIIGSVKNRSKGNDKLQGILMIWSPSHVLIKMKNVDDSLYKLPIYLTVNPDQNWKHGLFFDMMGYKKYSDIPAAGPWPYKDRAPYLVNCNPDWTLDGMFKKNNPEIRESLKPSLFTDMGQWEMVLGRYFSRVGDMPKKRAHPPEQFQHLMTTQLEHCIFGSLPTFGATKNSTGVGAEKVAYMLKEMGVMHDHQVYSYIWDNNNKTDLPLTGFADDYDYSELIDCSDSSCLTAPVLKTCAKKCSYKAGFFDAAAKAEDLKKVLQMEQSIKSPLLKYGTFGLGSYITYIYVFFWWLGTFLTPQKWSRSFFSILFRHLMHKYVTLAFVTWYLVHVTAFESKLYKLMKPVCFQHDRTNPGVSALAEYLPGFECNWYFEIILQGSATIFHCCMACTIIFVKNPKRKSFNINQSPYEEITGNDLAGNRIHQYDAIEDDKDIDHRNRNQVARAQKNHTRVLPFVQTTMDPAHNLFWRAYHVWFLLIGGLLYGSVSTFFYTIKETPYAHYDVTNNGYFLTTMLFGSGIASVKLLENLINNSTILQLLTMMIIDNGVVKASFYDIVSTHGKLMFIRHICVLPVTNGLDWFQAQWAPKAFQGRNASAVVKLIWFYISRIFNFMFFFKYLNVMQNFVGRYNRNLYVIIKWVVISAFFVMTGSIAMYLCTCGIQVQPAEIEYIMKANNPAFKPQEISTFEMVCTNKAGSLHGWAANLPSASTLQQYAFDLNNQYKHYTDYYQIDMLNWGNKTHMELDLAQMSAGDKPWYSPYMDNVMITMLYASIQIFSTAGLGDIPPVLPTERIIIIIYTFIAIFVAQTNFLNALSNFVASQIGAKAGYIMNAYGTFFVESDKQNEHRIEKTQSVLWYHWELWKGIMPLSTNSNDLNDLPVAIRQDLKYSILEMLLETKKSTLIHFFDDNDLRYLSAGLEYRIITAGDVVLNATEKQAFILCLYSGVMEITDSHGNVKGEVNPDKWQNEIDCFLGTSNGLNMKAQSSFVEAFLINRNHFIDSIKNNPVLYNKIRQKIFQAGSNMTERALVKPRLVLDGKSVGLQGYSAPITSQVDFEVPKFSDIHNYVNQTPSFNLDSRSQINYQTIDLESQDILNVSDFIKRRTKLMRDAGETRTADRLSSFKTQWNTIVSHEIEIAKDDDAIAETESKTRRISENLNAKRSQLFNEAMDRDDMTPVHYVQSKISRHLMKVDSNALNHTNIGHYFHQSIHEEAGFLNFPPDCKLVSIWNDFHCFHSIIALVVVSFQFAFYIRYTADNSDPYPGTGFYAKNYLLIDLIQCINWLFILRTGHLNDEHRLDYDMALSIKQLGVSRLIIELIGTIPYELIIWIIFKTLKIKWITAEETFPYSAFFLFLRLFKCLHYLRIAASYFAQKIHVLYGSPWSLLYYWLIPCLGIIQVTACWNYYISCTINTTPHHAACTPGSWAWELFGENNANYTLSDYNGFDRGIQTIYWKIKVYTTFNHANILPAFYQSRIIMSIEMFLGVCILSMVTALATSILLMSTKTSLLSDFKAHIETVKDKLQGHSCYDTVIATKKYMYMRYAGFAVNGVFNTEDNLFPDDKVPIKYSQTNDIIKNNIVLFMNLPASLLMKLSLCNNTFLYAKNQVIIAIGEAAPKLFYIKSGFINILDGAGESHGNLEAGMCFNTLEFISQGKSNYNFVAGCASELLEFNYAEVKEATSEYPSWDFFERLKFKAESKCKSLRLPKMKVDAKRLAQVADASADEKAQESFITKSISVGFSINSWTKAFFIYATIQKVRLLAHIFLTIASFSFMEENSTIKASLHIFDMLAAIEIFVNMFVQRRHPTTNMPITRSSFNILYYINNGFIYDLISILPFELILPRPFMLLRLLQFRQAIAYFNFIKENISIPAHFNFIWWTYIQIVLVLLTSAVQFRVCIVAGKAYFNANPGTSDVHVLQNLTSDTIYIKKDSWLGAPIERFLAGDDFRLTNPTTSMYDLFIMSIYFVADTLTGVGAGHMYPMSSSIKSLELIFQLIGWSLNLVIAASFSGAAAISDMVRENFTANYCIVMEFFQTTGAHLSGRTKRSILGAYQATWKARTGDLDKSIVKGLPTPLAREVSKELCKDYLGNIFDHQPENFNKIVQHFNILATPADTTIIKKNAIVDFAYYVGEGRYELRNNGKCIKTLTKGKYYISENKLSDYDLHCLTVGKLLTVPYEEMDFKVHEDTSGLREDPQDYAFEAGDVVCIVGCLQFFLALYRSYFESGFSVSDGITPLSNKPVKLVNMIIDIVMFVYIIINLIRCKIASQNKGKFNTEEYLVLVAALPLFFWKASWHKFLWFVILNYNYNRHFDNISANIYHKRLLRYGLWALLTIMILGCNTISSVCPKNVCNDKSMARDFTMLFTYNATSGIYTQTADISQWYVFLDIVYVTLILFSATGYGNILPQSTFMMAQSTANALLGRTVMGMVLGLSRDIADAALESIAAEYVTQRTRISHMMMKLNVKKYYHDYVLGYIDANFLRSKNKSITDYLSTNTVVGDTLGNFYYDLIGKRLENSPIFEGISTSCLTEICKRAAILENYFSGHVIQSHGSPVDSVLMILEGAVILGKRSVKIQGECIFAHHFYGDSGPAEINVYAFIRSEVVKLNKEKVLSVLSHYPDDAATFKANVDKDREISATNLMTSMAAKAQVSGKKANKGRMGPGGINSVSPMA